MTNDRYKDMMNDARNQSKCRSQSDSPVDWRDNGTPWIRAEHWDSLVNYWDTNKWKNNAKIAKENRIAQGQDGEMKKHTVGSVSFVTTKNRLDKYKAFIEFKYGTDSDDQPEFDSNSWINAVNGHSNGRIYGFGPRQTCFTCFGHTQFT
ncbi:Transpos assoc domain-containing protein [Abeliophyllum distichum]|uniref:Transpos assoc domain-containing protein n=1 Tax=Abeliophyllum distichum TaxID=126358 RepID=A0ABD1VXJ7_9LAMI